MVEDICFILLPFKVGYLCVHAHACGGSK